MKSLFTSITACLVAVLPVALEARPAGALVTYAGNSGIEEFFDVHELSDRTVLVAGSAENLSWTSAPKVSLPPLAIPDRSTGRTAYVMRLAADLQTVLGVWHLPAGRSLNIRWIKTTSRPGEATGAIYLSGSCDASSGEFFIARLNGNFVDLEPTGFDWAVIGRGTTNAYGENSGIQAWDVGGDGRIAYVDDSGDALRVHFRDANGDPVKLPGLRGSHWADGVTMDNVNRQPGTGSELPGTTRSAITFPADLRSWTDEDRLAILPDGNGSIKRGAWPLDLFHPVQDKNGGTTGTIEYGYTGYRSTSSHRIGGIAFHRGTNDFYIGFNIQTRFWDAPANKVQPDFEPAVIAYAADGTRKWWSRLYHEVVDSNQNGQIDPGETRLSSPDQYVDGLAIDYSTTPARVVVNARCHGNNSENLWEGNQIAASPGAKGFHNGFTGTEGDIHIGWVGKLRDSDGVLLRATYLAGYFRNTTLTQSAYPEAIHDGWPSHNSGWASLTTTRATVGSVRTDAAGRVYLVGAGPRMVTTANAWQKLPKITASVNEGISPWAQFARVFEPNLDVLAYSTALTGSWTYPSAGANPVGADNTDLYGAFPVNGGIMLAGRHRASAGTASGNPIPTNQSPPWGGDLPQNVSAIFAHLSFVGGTSTSPQISAAPTAQPSLVTASSSQISATAVDPDDAESSLIYTWSASSVPAGASVTFQPNGTNGAKSTTATFDRVGNYSIALTVTDPSGKTARAATGVTVQPTVTSISISPQQATVNRYSSVSFSGTATDQFGRAIAGATFNWSASGGGTLSGAGVFTAGSSAGGPHTITASAGGRSATAQVTILDAVVPELQVLPSAVVQGVKTGTVASRPVRIHNPGGQELTWQLEVASTAGSGGPAGSQGIGGITSFQTSQVAGGPDYSWIDIASGGTYLWAPTSGTVDDSSREVTFPAGFSFPFDGTQWSAVRVCTNGFVNFGTTTASQNQAYFNMALPSTGGPANMIAALWADWMVDTQSWVAWKAVDADRFVVTWNNIKRLNSSQRATFQVILHRNGMIVLQVKSLVVDGNRTYTIGIQNGARNAAVHVVTNPTTDYVPAAGGGSSSDFAVRFGAAVVVPAWLQIGTPSGSTPPGSESEVTLHFDAASMTAGTYQAQVRATTNAPGSPSLSIPVSMTVGTSDVVPNAPSGVNAVAAGATEVEVTWRSEGGGETAFRVEHADVGSEEWLSGGTSPASGRRATVSGLEPGGTRRFRVFAVNAAGDSSSSAEDVVTTWSPLQQWRHNHFGTIEDGGAAADGGDPDQDGVDNLMEFATGSLPTDPGSRPLILHRMSEGSDGGKELELLVPVRAGASFAGSPATAAMDGVLYVVEGSADLGTFDRPAIPWPVERWAELPAAPAGYEWQSFRLRDEGAATGSGFLRLKVERP